MGMGDSGWADRRENYADGFARYVTVSTAENLLGIDQKQPVVVYSITISPSQANASGDITLVDTSATGDAGTARFRAVIASSVTTDRPGPIHAVFPRGIVFSDGVVVSATTLTAAITLTYKARYS